MVVYIVGAGPGDLELITLKAKRLIENAQVILYDKLANPELLSWALPECKKIYVGKREAGLAPSQDIQKDIHDLIKEYGSNNRVVRLKGGDPFIFGRGGEEAQICVQNNIPFEIVPGISSCYAVPAYAGIPVSHRDFNSCFAVVTGHESEKDGTSIDWNRFPDNLVVLMGVAQIKKTAKNLIASGRDASTPAAGVRSGTTIEQRTEMYTLQELADKGTELKPPVVFVIGPIAMLHNELSWFEKKLGNLRGKRVVLTRAESHLSEDSELFESYGIQLLPMPLIRLVDREFSIPDINDYDALVFTSLEGVKRVSARVDIKEFGGKVFAIGPKTKKYIKDIFGVSATTGDTYNSDGLATHMLDVLENGSSVLALRSSAATGALKERLSEKFKAEEIFVYDIERLTADPETVRDADAVFVASASCAQSISELEPSVLENKLMVAIGPETSKNLTVKHITAPEHTMKGMIDKYIEYLWTGCE